MWNQLPVSRLRDLTYLGAVEAMASRAEIYRARAGECQATAEATTDPNVKAAYLDLAQRYRDLARQVDTLERKLPKPPN
jgi:hypothetical protein